MTKRSGSKNDHVGEAIDIASEPKKRAEPDVQVDRHVRECRCETADVGHRRAVHDVLDDLPEK